MRSLDLFSKTNFKILFLSLLDISGFGGYLAVNAKPFSLLQSKILTRISHAPDLRA
jgi:hypothetical protein